MEEKKFKFWKRDAVGIFAILAIYTGDIVVRRVFGKSN
jgi:hypothetical protein